MTQSIHLPAGAGTLILAVNAGSSSLRVGLFDATSPPRRIASGSADRIGSQESTLKIDASRDVVPLADHQSAMTRILDGMKGQFDPARLLAIGHRVVHGGPLYFAPERVTPSVVAELKRLVPFDPQHLPAQIGLIESLQRRFPLIPQLLCFDTAFHHDLPPVARRIAIPRKYDAVGVRRYGFHGLSFTYVMNVLRALGGEEWKGKIILAHLGNGCSLAAVRDGHCIDTSMCLTPAAGIPMGTRSGDIDPGLPGYLSRTTGMTLEEFSHMIHHESGLLGVSETTSDMQQLLEGQSTDHRAAEAIEIFCYQITKCIGGFAAALGGLDTLVFSGGIGEHSPEIRRLVCDRLEFLGINLDPQQNLANAEMISTDHGCKVRIIVTDEERVIATAVKHHIS